MSNLDKCIKDGTVHKLVVWHSSMYTPFDSKRKVRKATAVDILEIHYKRMREFF